MAEPRGKPSRRAALSSLKPGATTHPGLWLDKYIRTVDKEDADAKREFVKEVIRAAHGPRAAYSLYFERFRTNLAKRPSLTYTATGTTVGRLSVGLGANAVLETSITLHHTYGMPYIPGSALKGLASGYAAKHLASAEWKRSFTGGKTERGKLQELIFGTTGESGLVIFFDALPDPSDWHLDPDVITVHHPDYYQGKGKPPADWDSPRPVPFITARGTFHFFLGLVPLPEDQIEAGRKVLELAARLLKRALEEEGVGAKTTLGYGRFTLERDFTELTPPPPKRSEAYEKLASGLSGLGWNTPPHVLLQRLETFSELDEEEKKIFVEERRKALEDILGSPGAPNLKALKHAKDGSGLKLLAQHLGLL